MSFNAFVVDWTISNYDLFVQSLGVLGFKFEKLHDQPHLRIEVPYGRMDEFSRLCQDHLNRPVNYVDIQFHSRKLTVLVFKKKIFLLHDKKESQAARDWAIASGLPPEQADWAESF